jgi:hypothetical protein
MDMKSRKQYLKTLLGRYLKARKRQRGSILDEYTRNTGQNRKYVIRQLSDLASGKTKIVKKRAAVYGREVRLALEQLWQIFDGPCGQRLHPVIQSELDRPRKLGEISVTHRTANKLKRVSPATIDRLLRANKRDMKINGRYRRAGSGLIATKIPLRMGEWRNVQVGQIDLDLVLHCGSTTAGEYGHTLSTLDVFSQWWEGEVVMGRAQVRIFNALKEIRSRSPFAWRSIHTDNDNAFINDLTWKYTQDEGLGFTRSRPYRKNDNAYIEQKNYTHVRKPLGYLRYDIPEELRIIHDLYRHELRLYKNFFQPVMRLIEKERVNGRRLRRYDTPKTPCQRLLESDRLSVEEKAKLQQIYQNLNPADLKRRIDKKLNILFDVYRKKKKKTLVVNPYKKLEPSMVTFLMRERPSLRLPT